MEDRRFCAYLLYDPRDYVPFYCGEGTYSRPRRHWYASEIEDETEEMRVKLKELLSLNLEPIIDFISKDLTKDDAIILQGKAIFQIGRKCDGRGPLLNIQDGTMYSHGYTGYRQTEEVKRAVSLAQTGRVRTPEEINKMRTSLIEYNRNMDPSRREEIRNKKRKSCGVAVTSFCGHTKERIKTYYCIKDAGQEGYDSRGIQRALIGRCEKYKGLIWQYATSEEMAGLS